MNINFTPINNKSLLSTYSNYPSGVCVVCASYQSSPLTITVSSLAVVSLSPAIISWSLDNNNQMYERFCQSNYQAINVLNAKQAPTALAFSKDEKHIDKIQSKAKLIHKDNFWLLPDYHMILKCSLNETKIVGDHTIIFLNIIATSHNNSTPLIYFNRQYNSL